MPPTPLSLLLAAGIAIGQTNPGSLVERFDQIDRNRDGVVTRVETGNAAWFERLLQRLDRDRDGRLQRREVVNVGRPGRAASAPWPLPPEPEHVVHRDLRYAEIAGVDPNLLSLDLYVPKDGNAAAAKRPVVIMIHGGGWRGGDKANPVVVGAKMRHFVGKGAVYASINYRLSPRTPREGGLVHPVHAEDCAKAIAWIHDHVAEYGGDAERIHLMGHSAGGHLAAILGTNERFLAAEGKSLAILRSNVLLDPAALDVPRYLESVDGRGMTLLYELAFGRDPANQRDASPMQHVEPNKSIPPTIVFHAGDRMHLDVLAPAFAKALTNAGSPSRAVDTVDLDHGQINSHIGLVGEPMTALVDRLHAGEDASRFPSRIAGRADSSAN